MDLVPVETNQSLGLAPTGSAVQERPTSPEILDAEIPEGRWGVTAAAVGESALLPIIMVRFHRSTITILGEWNLQHRRCPELHWLPPIVPFPGKGGAMLVPLLVLEEPPVPVPVPGLAGLGLVLGTAAAARVAKARATRTLNCILCFFFAVMPTTEYWGLFV